MQVTLGRERERMALDGRVKAEAVDGVGLLTFCGKGPRNAVTAETWRMLTEAVERLEADPAIGVLVLTGAGHQAFATDPADPDPAYRHYGQTDSGQMAAEPGEGAGRGACARLLACEKPVLARVRGECTGAGLALALCADIRIAAADAAFALTGARAAELGVEGLLAGIAGPAQARYLLLTGERIETPEARRIGLITRVVPDAELSDVVADLARQLADGDAEAMRATKRRLAGFGGGAIPG